MLEERLQLQVCKLYKAFFNSKFEALCLLKGRVQTEEEENSMEEGVK